MTTERHLRLNARRAKRALLAQRWRSHDGAQILPHRSISRLPLPRHRLLIGVAIAAAYSVLLLASGPLLADVWGSTLHAWLRWTGLDAGFVGAGASSEREWPALALPHVERLPGGGGLIGLAPQALLVAAVWLASARLPDWLRPAMYIARLGAIVHGLALAYFAVWPASFGHSVASHVDDQLGQAWLLMVIVPWLHLLIYHLLPLRWWRRVALTGLTLAWLALAAPHLVALHVVALEVFGTVAMPLLYMLFGAMPLVLGIVALYGWAMSWQPPQGRAWGEPVAPAADDDESSSGPGSTP